MFFENDGGECVLSRLFKGVPERFDRFTEAAREVLAASEGEARSLRHGYIGTEHLLLGVAAVSESVGARALAELAIDYERARAALLEVVAAGDAPPEAPIGLTPRAKRAVELAVREAGRLKHQYVGSEHLLLGLAAVEEGIAAQALRELGASAE